MLQPCSLLSLFLRSIRAPQSVPQSGPRLAISVSAYEMSFSCFRLLSADGKNSDPSKVALGMSTNVRHRHLRCITSPKERGSPPRRTLSPSVLLAKVRLLSAKSDLQVRSQVRAPHRQHGSIAHDTMSSQLLHARQRTVGTCEIRERSPAPAVKHMTRAASGSTHTHAHTLPSHARSITTRRSQYPVGQEHVLRSLPLQAFLWHRAPAYASIRILAVVITESGDVLGQEQQGV